MIKRLVAFVLISVLCGFFAPAAGIAERAGSSGASDAEKLLAQQPADAAVLDENAEGSEEADSGDVDDEAVIIDISGAKTGKLVEKKDIFNELEIFADALTLVSANYVIEPDNEQMIYGALKGMLSSLDSHSSFLTPEEYKDLQSGTKGEFGGLGMKVTIRDKVLTVITPLEGTPAQKAGILPGDKIIEIDEEPTEDMTLDDAISRLRGVPGTPVTITVLRKAEEKLLTIEMKRAIIKVQSVRTVMLPGNEIGYIRISEFQRNTPRDFNKALKKLLEQHARYLILDLRNNPGGLLETSIKISEQFLKRGDMIVFTRGRVQGQNAEFKSYSLNPYVDLPIAVMINEGSASASEIVAGALKDNKRAVLVGAKSFGKGSVQTVIPMKDASALRLTTSYYYTPSGRIIHEKGIEPDLYVEYESPKKEPAENTDDKSVSPEEEKEIPEEDIGEEKKDAKVLEILSKDNQIQKAIEVLRDAQKYESLLENEKTPEKISKQKTQGKPQG